MRAVARRQWLAGSHHLFEGVDKSFRLFGYVKCFRWRKSHFKYKVDLIYRKLLQTHIEIIRFLLVAKKQTYFIISSKALSKAHSCRNDLLCIKSNKSINRQNEACSIYIWLRLFSLSTYSNVNMLHSRAELFINFFFFFCWASIPIL